MVSTRANRGPQSSALPTQATSHATKHSKRKRNQPAISNRSTTAEPNSQSNTQDTITQNSQHQANTGDEEIEEESNTLESQAFRSRFVGLDIDNFEDQREDWTLIGLRQAIAKQNARTSKAPPEIKLLVLSIRMEYEKRMLMAALMGGVPEIVVWNIV